MSDENEKKIEAEVADESEGTETTAQEPAAESEGSAVEIPEVRIALLEAEVAELKDKLLRALAETENVRRRSDRQRAETSRYAIANFAREMVVVADNLRRALDSVDEEARKNDENLANLCEGIEMTERAMLSAFERVEIRRIEAMGKRFDHNYHEAMFEVEDASQPSGTVVHVMETGYTISDRLLRPSKVGVSKGGPKVAPSENGAASQDGGAKAQNAYESQGSSTGSTFDEKL